MTKLQDAQVEAKVSKGLAQLRHEFDERLQQKVEDLIKNYGNETELIKSQAQAGAKKARNEALNLACPHCATVYAEFDGCMALKCSSCNLSFCGYCHKGFPDSRGAHDHVRECDANLTRNGSYYATAEEIKEAQRRYRIKKLKKFLRSQGYKKQLQNAMIIELAKDLDDLQVDPAALFDFGNLQADE